MESKKVKEIKKALEQRTQHKPINCYNGEYVEACGIYCKFYRKFVADMGSNNGQICENCGDFTATDEVKGYADILTLINELESENERLSKSDTSKEESSIEYYNLYKDLKRKNKDLNELCELQRVSIAENFVKENQLKDRIAELEKEKTEQLKQFAERLKDKGETASYINKNNHIDLLEYFDDIDETLKEFIGNV